MDACEDTITLNYSKTDEVDKEGEVIDLFGAELVRNELVEENIQTSTRGMIRKDGTVRRSKKVEGRYSTGRGHPYHSPKSLGHRISNGNSYPPGIRPVQINQLSKKENELEQERLLDGIIRGVKDMSVDDNNRAERDWVSATKKLKMSGTHSLTTGDIMSLSSFPTPHKPPKEEKVPERAPKEYTIIQVEIFNRLKPLSKLPDDIFFYELSKVKNSMVWLLSHEIHECNQRPIRFISGMKEGCSTPKQTVNFLMKYKKCTQMTNREIAQLLDEAFSRELAYILEMELGEVHTLVSSSPITLAGETIRQMKHSFLNMTMKPRYIKEEDFQLIIYSKMINRDISSIKAKGEYILEYFKENLKKFRSLDADSFTRGLSEFISQNALIYTSCDEVHKLNQIRVGLSGPLLSVDYKDSDNCTNTVKEYLNESEKINVRIEDIVRKEFCGILSILVHVEFGRIYSDLNRSILHLRKYITQLRE